LLQAEDGIRDPLVTGVQTCAIPISRKTSPLQLLRRSIASLEDDDCGRRKCRDHRDRRKANRISHLTPRYHVGEPLSLKRVHNDEDRKSVVFILRAIRL